MNLPDNPYVLPALLSAVIATLLAVFIWRRRPAPGARTLGWVAVAAAVWCLGYSFELASVDLPRRIIWAKIEYFGILGTTLGWLAFALEYTGRERFLTGRIFAILAIVPLIALGLVWTNEYHGLIWSRFELDTQLGFVMSSPTRNVAFWIHFAYLYGLLLASTLLLIQPLFRPPFLYRKQATALVIAAFAPWAGNALFLSGLSPFPRLDLTPLAFTLGGAVLAWGLYRHRLLDLVPVARDKVIENLQDAMLVLDSQNRIVDANQAAEVILGIRAERVIGKPSAAVPDAFAALVQQYGQATEAQTEVALGVGEAERHFDLRISSFKTERREQSVGRLWVFRDITERKRAEDTLRTLNDELERRVANRTAALTRLNAELMAEISERTRVAEALQASEERYRAVIETQSDLVCRWRADGTLTFVNEAFCHAVGKSSQELLGSNLLAYASPEEVEKTKEFIASVRPNNPNGMLEQHVRLSSGEEHWYQWQARAIFGAQDQLIEIQSVGRDITELKRAEEGVRLQAARANALASTAARLNSRLDLNKVLEAICEETARALSVPAVAVFMHDKERGMLVPAAATGLPKSKTEFARIPLKQYNQYAQKLDSIVVIRDIQAEAGLTNVPIFAEMNIRTVASSSMLRDGHLLGILAPMNFAVREFTEDELNLLKALADQAALAISNARLFKDTERSLQHLQALREIDLAIAGSMDLNVVLKVVLDQVKSQLRVDAAQVLLHNPQQQSLNYAMGIGFNTNAFQHTRMRIGDGYAGRAALEQRSVEVSDLIKVPNERIREALRAQEGFVYYRATPLVSKGLVRGVLEIFHRSRLYPSLEWQQTLEGLATQAAIAIDNATLFDKLQQSNTELGLAYESTIEGWSRALDLRDRETEGHTRRVTELAVRLARALGMKPEELVNLRRGALLHDIGKMGISDTVLLKPGPLTDAERVIMQMHPGIAYELLSPIPHLRPALDIPYCHHERWDGSGYPRGLKGEQIPLAARVFAVVDVWDALRSSRPYREPWSDEKTKQYIREQAGKHFDPTVIEAFKALDVSKELESP